MEDVSLSECIFILNNVISGLESSASPSDSDALNSVLKTYLSIIERENCELAVEGVGVACQILGDKIDTGFVLSKLFTNVRSDNLRAINILYHALRDIANGLDASIQDVIHENVDHLSKDLNLNLRKVNSLSNPGECFTSLSLLSTFDLLTSFYFPPSVIFFLATLNYFITYFKSRCTNAGKNSHESFCSGSENDRSSGCNLI